MSLSTTEYERQREPATGCQGYHGKHREGVGGRGQGRYFYKCLEKAGLRRIRFHDLRHSFASLLIQNGEPLAYVKEQLGQWARTC